MASRRRTIKPLSTTQILAIMIGSLAFLLLYLLFAQFGLDRSTSFLDVVMGFLVLSTGIVFILATLVARRKWRLTKALQIADVDKMDGTQFEQYVGKLLEWQGYKIKFTPATGDYGVDIVAKKEDISYAVQVKRYSGSVGVEAINQAVAGKAYYSCGRAMVVTNSFFTNQAFQLARANYVKLINRTRLAAWIVDFQKQ